MILDDLEEINQIDSSNMIDELTRFPEQIKEIVDNLKEASFPKIYNIKNIIISGMGGSAISGDILNKYLRNKLSIPVFVNRYYDLPKWANKNTLVIAQSYSGNTEETLSAFKHAYEKNCNIIAITSGGKLSEYSSKRNIFNIKIPSGYPPRTATGYLLFSALISLKKIGLYQHNIESDIEESIQITKELLSEINENIPLNENLAKQIASKINDTIPQIYGWGIYEPIAKRWATQFNENSKVISRYGFVTECNHNDMEGWGQNPKVTKQFTCILLRDKKLESISFNTRLNFMIKLFNDAAANVIEVNINGKCGLAKLMYSMYLGDFISFYHAVLRNVDPTPVTVISQLKDELMKI
jgi:glucose/mannose-6-phosphate isomerase